MKPKTICIGVSKRHKHKTYKHLVTQLLFLLLFVSSNLFAAQTTHNWSESHRGYSVELVPGTGGTTGAPAEYVAAGTVYDFSNPNYTGWHFMHLDDNGNIISSRIAWASTADQQSFKVVDIAVQNANAYRITIQGRIQASGLAQDYIYIQGVDITGADLPAASNPQITIFSSDDSYSNMYPTHSFYAINSLYICGYSAMSSQYPSTPDNKTTAKVGFMMKVDVNASPSVTHTETYWDSYGATYDYDMPLRIAAASYATPFPLLVTGAVNDSLGKCAVLAFEFDSTLSAGGNAIQSTIIGPDEADKDGIYGVDIRGEVGYYSDNNPETSESGDKIILVNYFNDNNPYEKTWGIIRVKNTFQTYPLTMSSMRYFTNKNSWANQFLELHTGGSPGFTNMANHIPVVGQVINFDNAYCQIPSPLPSLAKSPSLVNVNPFICTVDVGASYWSTATGFTNPPIGPYTSVRTFLSAKGTNSTNLDYLPGTIGYNAALEDVSRLYTFASLVRYYDDPTVVNPPIVYPAMVVPMGEDPAKLVSNLDLLTKFIGLSTSYAEAACSTYVDDCPYHDVAPTYNAQPYFVTPVHTGSTVYPGYLIFSLVDNLYSPSATSCYTGNYYKSTGVKDIKSAQLKVYPNPASTELNVSLPTAINKSDKFSFNLTDITGKLIYHTDKVVIGSNTVNIKLPELAKGMYMVNVSLNDIKHTEKVVIQ